MTFRAMAAGTTLLAAAALAAAGGAAADERVRVVGSSTVFPYTEIVAERFAQGTGFPAPVVESTGTGGGFEIFCAPPSADAPDIAGASRPITRAEWELCQANGVDNITEVLIGYDGLTIAHAKGAAHAWQLTPRQLFDALAARLPADGDLVANPHGTWAEVDPALPDLPIRVIGPPPTSGTRDSFVELVLEVGCRSHPALAALEEAEPDTFAQVCSDIRADGAFEEAGEDDAAIVAALAEDPDLLGIFGYSNLFLNEDVLAGVRIAGVVPNFITIATGEYPLARPLFIYINNARRPHTPGLTDFIMEYVSPDTISPHGYLVESGLTPVLDEAERETNIARAMIGEEMTPPAR